VRKIFVLFLVPLFISCGYLGPDGETTSKVEIEHKGEGQSKVLFGIDKEICEIFDSQDEKEWCVREVLKKSMCILPTS